MLHFTTTRPSRAHKNLPDTADVHIYVHMQRESAMEVVNGRVIHHCLKQVTECRRWIVIAVGSRKMSEGPEFGERGDLCTPHHHAQIHYTAYTHLTLIHVLLHS